TQPAHVLESRILGKPAVRTELSLVDSACGSYPGFCAQLGSFAGGERSYRTVELSSAGWLLVRLRFPDVLCLSRGFRGRLGLTHVYAGRGYPHCRNCFTGGPTAGEVHHQRWGISRTGEVCARATVSRGHSAG